jgi:hypothetical protein
MLCKGMAATWLQTWLLSKFSTAFKIPLLAVAKRTFSRLNGIINSRVFAVFALKLTLLCGWFRRHIGLQRSVFMGGFIKDYSEFRRAKSSKRRSVQKCGRCRRQRTRGYVRVLMDQPIGFRIPMFRAISMQKSHRSSSIEFTYIDGTLSGTGSCIPTYRHSTLVYNILIHRSNGL